MNLRQITARGKQGPPNGAELIVPSDGRCLTMLTEAMAAQMPEINSVDFKAFREKVSELAQQMPDRLPETDKVALIGTIVRECERYRKLSEETLRDRVAGWRTVVSRLLVDALSKTGIDPTSSDAAPLVRRVASLLTAEEIQGFVIQLVDFFRLSNVDSKSAQLSVADRSTANHNATGLRGGGAAFKHVSKIMEGDSGGYVVLFHLNCLGMIGERFGMDAVQDSLMAVSAFLTHSLRSDDAIYHWSDTSLLAVLQTPVSVPILTAAMRRIVDNNRDITIQIGGRTVMLRIPLDFEITAISRLTTAADLNKLSAPSAKKW